MSLDTSFFNLLRGNRLGSYLGFVPDDKDAPLKYAQDYTYIEIPLAHFEKDGEATAKVLRNQHVAVVPACSLECRGNLKIEVEPNPALGEYGIYTPGYYINPGNPRQRPVYWFQARKDLNATDLQWAVRLYLRG